MVDPADLYRSAIGARISTARRGAGLSQRELARQLGTNERAVRGWELGEHLPVADMLGRIAAITRRSADWILGRPDGDFVCLINTTLEHGILSGGKPDMDTLVRALRVSIVADAAVESVTVGELSRRLSDLATHVAGTLPDGKSHAKPG